MNRHLYKFGLYGYILTCIGIFGFFGLNYFDFFMVSFAFLALLVVGIFLLAYKNNGILHRAIKKVITFDFLYVVILLGIAAIELPKGLSLVIVAVIGTLGGYTLLTFTFRSY